MLHWRRAFRSDHHPMDEDHQRLFQLFNRLEGLGRPKHGADLGRVNEGIEALVGYALTHCTQEEDLMNAVGYPGAAAHALEHERMREDFFGVLRPLTAGDITVATFVKLARGRFVMHFMNDDYAFVKWNRDRRAETSHGGPGDPGPAPG